MWKKIIIIVLSLELLHKAASQSTCSAATRFTCKDGICISRAKLCNGKVDCSGAEDETDCDSRAECRPRDKNMAIINGYRCSSPCRKKSQNCQGRATKCICDDECGRSCINERTRCIRDPPPVENGVFRRKRYYYGDVAIFRCRLGLTLHGPLPRCTGHGVWSAEIPECVDTRCHEEKPTVYHSVDSYATRNAEGRVEIVRSPPYHVGDVLIYVCESGRTLQGHLPRCGEDGRWSRDVPTCVAWAQWEQWSTCSNTCGNGERTRTRMCNNGPGCIGEPAENEACNIRNCPAWTEWEEWSTCSKTCDIGERTRTRTCNDGPGCAGNMDDKENCNTQACQVIYNGQRYFAILHRTQDISHNHGERICRGAGGTIAGIWNKQHQTLIENYVRAILQNSDLPDGPDIWLSMTYDYSTKTLTMPNGDSFPSTTLRWYPGSPNSSSSYTSVMFYVRKEVSYPKQGLFDYIPSYAALGVLCVK